MVDYFFLFFYIGVFNMLDKQFVQFVILWDESNVM